VTWISPANLGTVYNGITSIKYVEAVSDVPLQYRLVGGQLPPNLTLLPNGELSGIVAFQPTEITQDPNTTTTFTFEIEAFSPNFASVVNSTRTFTLNVYQEFGKPFDTLYCKCTPSISDRNMIASLLNDESLIPTEYLYRSDDPYYGKAQNVTYEHAYGIYANDIDAYIAAISTKNHYWRNITLGEIKTAIARDEVTGEIIYEVVYSEVIDNLVNYNHTNSFSNGMQSNIVNPQGQSVSKEIFWPRPIPLFLGPWYTSETDIYTSYEGENSPPPTYYTSRTPGFARLLYPNSLPNMRQQVVDVLGQDYNYKLLPLWMTSQQRNGSTLGFTPAWVIAYCKPGPNLSIAVTLTNAITNEMTVNSTNGFVVGRPVRFSGSVFGNVNANTVYYIREITSATTFTISSTPNLEQEYSLSTATGSMTASLPSVSYAEIIKENINTNWKTEYGSLQTLNTINFKIDRFTVDKSATYNFNNTLSPATWTQLPSATPTPDPIDSKDFYVLFPRETILPDETQYDQ
jgi:hypothetical protein